MGWGKADNRLNSHNSTTCCRYANTQPASIQKVLASASNHLLFDKLSKATGKHCLTPRAVTCYTSGES